MTSKKWVIYVLVDPRNEVVRYVGYSYRLSRRIVEHLYEKNERTHKANWIRTLRTLGMIPQHRVIDSGYGESGRWAAERYWIFYYRSIGANLTNGTDGGDGAPGHIKSDETRAKLSAAFKGKPRPREVIVRAMETKRARGGQTSKQLAALQLISQGNIGRKRSAETLHRMAEVRIGKPGHPHTPESRRKMSRARKGKPKSAETRAKMAAAAKSRYAQEGQSMFQPSAGRN